MSNSVFHFQKFSIYQDQCAMKVSTDACVFGAWLSQIALSLPIANVLDIGAGTGVLSLMYVQKNPEAHIHAVELDSQAAMQCQENFKNSVYTQNLTSIPSDINTWKNDCLFDLVMSNPPFFIDDLKNENEQKKIARHTITLSYEQLIHAINTKTHAQSLVAIMLPPSLMKIFEKQMQNHNWMKNRELYFASNRNKTAHIHCILFSKKKIVCQTEFLFYKDEKQQDTFEFQHLLRDYYLYLA